jgi:hypothetical protein
MSRSRTNKPSRRTAKAAAKPARKRANPKRPAARQPGPAPAGPYLGQIALLAFDFAPPGWAPCNGQLLPISQNVALFELIHATYGGNGHSNFALPNLPPRGPSGPYYCIALAGVTPA